MMGLTAMDCARFPSRGLPIMRRWIPRTLSAAALGLTLAAAAPAQQPMPPGEPVPTPVSSPGRRRPLPALFRWQRRRLWRARLRRGLRTRPGIAEAQVRLRRTRRLVRHLRQYRRVHLRLLADLLRRIVARFLRAAAVG